MKDRADTQHDLATSLGAEPLDALLLRFVEDLIAEDAITVQDVTSLGNQTGVHPCNFLLGTPNRKKSALARGSDYDRQTKDK